MEIILTTCCKEKDDSAGLIPAVRRYINPRISKVANIAQSRGQELFFFSGKFGLIHNGTPIPWYDKILVDDELDAMTVLTTKQLQAYDITSVSFYGLPRETEGWGNYYSVIELACAKAGITLFKNIIS